MISIWEAVQGLVFMGVFGGITRAAFQEHPRKRPNTPQAASGLPAGLPVPRRAVEEHETLVIG